MVHEPPPRIPAAALEDLRARLRAFSPVPLPPGHGWERGVDPDHLTELVAHWADAYDWPEHEARIRSLPWERAGTIRPLRVVHQAVSGADRTVLLLHGWPDSVLRFERLLPLLSDVNVVIPALPGFPFALPVPEGGASAIEMATWVGDAMADLGYERYVVSAGDVGCDVAEALAAQHPDRVAALHLTDVSQYHFLAGAPADPTPEEEAYLEHGHRWQAAEGGYMHEQSTKPQTLALALGDSPAGTAAWILEKLRSWTDGDGDVSAVFSTDELLTWISAYWLYRSIGTSFTPYAAGGGKPWPRITVPTAFTVFPKDLVNAPRRFAERVFDVRVWSEFERGGHFAAWEVPLDYEKGVRSALRLADEAAGPGEEGHP
jgi:pimeloyl-ACP methyl ester carboxylesterase